MDGRGPTVPSGRSRCSAGVSVVPAVTVADTARAGSGFSHRWPRVSVMRSRLEGKIIVVVGPGEGGHRGRHESRRPRGALECVPLEAGRVRMGCIRRPGCGGRRRCGRARDEGLGDRERGVAACRADPRRGELQDPGARERAGAVARPGRSISRRSSRWRWAAWCSRSRSSRTLPGSFPRSTTRTAA